MTITMNRKIPGFLPPIPRSETEGKLDKLELKTKFELLEVLERQDKLLSNRQFINKLPDKGNKIKIFREKIVKELSLKDEIEQSCALLSNLNIQSSSSIGFDKDSVANIEWQSKRTEDVTEVLDSDDDSDPEDVLAVLAKSRDLKKKIVYLKKESLIKPEDIDIPKNDEDGLDEHVKYLFEKTVNKSKDNQKVSFKPYKTTKSNSHDPSKEIHRKRNKYWEVTAATPPPAIHGAVQEIPLIESMKLQEYQNLQLKEIQIKHAAEKLANQLGKSSGNIPLSSLSMGNYREVAQLESDDSDNSSDHETSDHEVHDDEPNQGGVVFTIMK